MDNLVYRKAKKPHLELIGQQYGRLTVINLIGYRQYLRGKKTVHEPVYQLQCSCGKSVTLRRVDFKYGNTRSCGCLRQEIVYEKFANNRSVSDSTFYKTQVFNSYTRKANSRNQEFELSFNEFDKLISSPCHYCGIKPSNEYKYKSKNSTLFYNGVDRVNNNIGYTVDNAVSCCKTCNFLKGRFNVDEFVEQIERIHSHCSLSQQCGLKNRAKSEEAEMANTEVTI